ncbi:MAG: triose-phosphate isomerase [Alphaproteobacteria bacterium]|nr:triose-phosphate isomerase [Alphaproteobacteria bacterium]
MSKSWIIGNWKMNGSRADAVERAITIIKQLPSEKAMHHLDYRVVICPPAPFLGTLETIAEDSMLLLGAQDCHPLPSGAYTGGISAEMLRDAGASLVIIGHSERRTAGDDDDAIKAKVAAVVRAKMVPIICVGEDMEARAIGREKEMVTQQISHSIPKEAKNIIIAYEPAWAIGSGKAADEEEITEIFERIILYMEKDFPHIKFALCYGGSVTQDNAADLLKIKGCNGLLVGGASLQSDKFLKIISIVQAQT